MDTSRHLHEFIAENGLLGRRYMTLHLVSDGLRSIHNGENS